MIFSLTLWDFACINNSLILLCGGGGCTGGGNPGVMREGSLREGGEEGAGDGISMGGEREKWENFRNIGTIFRNRKSAQGRNCYGRGREPGFRVREAERSDPLSYPTPPPPL